MKNLDYNSALNAANIAKQCFQEQALDEYVLLSEILLFQINRLLENMKDCQSLMININNKLQSKVTNNKEFPVEGITWEEAIFDHHRERALYFRDLADYKKSYEIMTYLTEKIQVREIINPKLIRGVWELSGEIYFRLDFFDDAVKYLEKLVDYTIELAENDPIYRELVCKGYYKLGNLHKRHQFNQKALYYFQQSLSYERKDDNGNIRKDLATLISIIEAKFNIWNKHFLQSNSGFITNPINLDELIKEFMEFFPKIEKTKDQQMIATSYYDLGYMFEFSGDLDKALNYLNKSYEIRSTINDVEGLSATVGRIINILQHNYKMNDKLYTIIVGFLLKLKTDVETYQSKTHKVLGYYNIGQFSININQFTDAINYFNKCYLALKEYRKQFSNLSYIKSSISSRLTRFSFVWALTAAIMIKSLGLETIRDWYVWEIIENTQNYELLCQKRIDWILSNKIFTSLSNYYKSRNETTLIIGFLYDFVPGYPSRLIRLSALYSEKEDDFQLNSKVLTLDDNFDFYFSNYFTRINSNTNFEDQEFKLFQNLQILSEKEKIRFNNSHQEKSQAMHYDVDYLKYELRCLAKNMFQDINFTSLDLNNVILIPYGPLQNLPLEEMLRLFSEEQNFKTDFDVQRDISLLTFSEKITSGQTIKKKNLNGLIVDYADVGDSRIENVITEGNYIENVFKDINIKFERLSGKNASKEVILNKLVLVENPVNLYHHASHGKFDLDPTQQSISTSTGRIKVNDILEKENFMNSPSVVVLSSCESGAIQHYNSSETLGLVLGFSVKDITSLIATLYSVNDEIALSLMSEFYENLKTGLNTSRALSNAKSSIMNNLKDKISLNQYYSIIAWHHIGPWVKII